MTPTRKRRLGLVVVLVLGVGIAAGFALKSFNQNLMFFFSPAEVAAGKAPPARKFRLGGMVVKGSVHRDANNHDKESGLMVSFDLTDNADTVKVEYTGILPDLFREGQGIIAHGTLRKDGVFVADEVLAKHDEKYMPPEVAESMKPMQSASSVTP